MISKQRVRTAIVGLIIAFGIVAFAPPLVFNAIVCVIVILSFNELLRMYQIDDETIFYRFTIIVFIGLCLTFLFSSKQNFIEAGLILALLVTVLATLFVINDKRGSFEYATKTVFCATYVLFLLYLIKLRLMPTGKELIFVLCAGTWGRDLAAFLGGRLIKTGHVILPEISPRKTYEVAIFALVFTIIAVFLITHWLLPNWTPSNILAISIGIGVLGQIGDLTESWLKRNAQVTDSSQILPAQGGILDSFDSFIFTAPAMYLYVTMILIRQA